MGQIRKRGNVWWIRYYRNGKLHEESARTPRYKDAQDLLRDREGLIAKGVAVTPRMGRCTIEDGLADVVTDYTLNGRKSLGHLQRRIDKHLTPYFAGRRMGEISSADILRYAETRKAAGAANGSINRELAILKRAFRLAVRHKRLAERPEIDLLQEDNVRTGFLEREQFATLLPHLPDVLQGVATLAFYSSWRTSAEILPLQWRQVDRKTSTLTLDPGTTKNKEGSLYPYAENPAVKAVIEAQWASHEALRQRGTLCPYVFHRHGKRIKDFRHAWDSACQAAGFPWLLIHDLRRSGIRNLVRRGVGEGTAMKISGHRTRSVFERYNIVSETDIREAVAKSAKAEPEAEAAAR